MVIFIHDEKKSVPFFVLFFFLIAFVFNFFNGSFGPQFVFFNSNFIFIFDFVIFNFIFIFFVYFLFLFSFI